MDLFTYFLACMPPFPTPTPHEPQGGQAPRRSHSPLYTQHPGQCLVHIKFLTPKSWKYKTVPWHIDCLSGLTYITVVPFNSQPEPFWKVGHRLKKRHRVTLSAWAQRHCWDTSGKSDGSARCGLTQQYNATPQTGHLEDYRDIILRESCL